jgi:hypothetical protein
MKEGLQSQLEFRNSLSEMHNRPWRDREGTQRGFVRPVSLGPNDHNSEEINHGKLTKRLPIAKQFICGENTPKRRADSLGFAPPRVSGT